MHLYVRSYVPQICVWSLIPLLRNRFSVSWSWSGRRNETQSLQMGWNRMGLLRLHRYFWWTFNYVFVRRYWEFQNSVDCHCDFKNLYGDSILHRLFLLCRWWLRSKRPSVWLERINDSYLHSFWEHSIRLHLSSLHSWYHLPRTTIIISKADVLIC